MFFILYYITFSEHRKPTEKIFLSEQLSISVDFQKILNQRKLSDQKNDFKVF